MIRWEEQPDGNWLGFSGQALVSTATKRDENRWDWEVPGAGKPKAGATPAAALMSLKPDVPLMLTKSLPPPVQLIVSPLLRGMLSGIVPVTRSGALIVTLALNGPTSAPPVPRSV